MPIENPDDRVSSRPIKPTVQPSLADDPFDEPALPRLGGGSAGEGGLSSLAQSARSSQLKSAKTTMIVIGVLTMILQVASYFLVQSQIADEMRRAGMNMNNAPAEVKMAIAVTYGFIGLFFVLGLTFVVLGFLVPKYPVPCTVIGLTLYVLAWVGSAIASPTTISAGIVVRIIITVALAKAVGTAIAYQREKTAMETDEG